MIINMIRGNDRLHGSMRELGGPEGPGREGYWKGGKDWGILTRDWVEYRKTQGLISLIRINKSFIISHVLDSNNFNTTSIRNRVCEYHIVSTVC